MCGIAGIVQFEATRCVDRDGLRRMSTALAHRGPDGDGIWCAPGVGLVNRRLAIVDAAAGALPMVAPDERAAIAYNGEIFGTESLRQDLAAKGWRFRTRSDAEIVLAAYLCLGNSCLDRLEGQFAFAIWDAAKGELFVARDQFGICPLVYVQTQEGLIFASEVKALLAWPGVVARADSETVSDQLVAGCMPAGRTAFADIAALPPGHAMRVDATGARIWRWYALPRPAERAPPAAGEQAVRLTDALTTATRARLPIETGWGALLSGGLDSSTIALLAADAAGGGFTAYTIDYPDPWKDRTDSDFAALIAERIGCRHIVFEPEPEAYFQVLSRVVRTVEQPFNKAAATAWLLYQAIGAREKVVLCGDGADELFAGYLNSPGMEFVDSADDDGHRLPWVAHGALALSLLDRDFTASVRSRERRADLVADIARAAGPRRGLERYLYQYATIFLPEILQLQDHCSYSVGIETRYPFLDRAVVAIALERLPKLEHGPKAVLRSAVTQLLPNAVLTRRKSHLPIPRSPTAIRAQGRLAADLLLAPDARVSRYLDRRRLNDFLRRPAVQTGRDAIARWQFTMYLITLELHHREFSL